VRDMRAEEGSRMGGKGELNRGRGTEGERE
jgi:hypothetical protein